MASSLRMLYPLIIATTHGHLRYQIDHNERLLSHPIERYQSKAQIKEGKVTEMHSDYLAQRLDERNRNGTVFFYEKVIIDIGTLGRGGHDGRAFWHRLHLPLAVGGREAQAAGSRWELSENGGF